MQIQPLTQVQEAVINLKIGVVGTEPYSLLLIHRLVIKGCQVIIQDADKKNLELTVAQLGKHIDGAMGRGEIDGSDRESLLSRLQLTMDLPPLHSADLILLSPAQDDGTLLKNLMILDQSASPGTTFMLSVSTSSVTKWSRDLRYPGRLVGVHFLSPRSETLGVEIVRGVKTDSQSLRAVKDLFGALGLSWIVAHDFPGYMVNRLVAPLINEAIFAVYEGAGTAEEVDRAYQLGTGQTTGPLALADHVGLDAVLEILNGMYHELGYSRYAPCPLLVKYVEAGYLGKKSGKGFFEY